MWEPDGGGAVVGVSAVAAAAICRQLTASGVSASRKGNKRKTRVEMVLISGKANSCPFRQKFIDCTNNSKGQRELARSNN